MTSRIQHYALIGDCESAALVGRDGSIDWLCWPRFDSDGCFAALLGTPENGRFRIAPKGEVKNTTRRYRPDTLILETRFPQDVALVNTAFNLTRAEKPLNSARNCQKGTAEGAKAPAPPQDDGPNSASACHNGRFAPALLQKSDGPPVVSPLLCGTN